MAPRIDPIALFMVMAVMSIVPMVAMVVTSYAKIVVVLGLLRNALGVQQVPPNMVLNGVAIMVSCYIMAPIFMDASERMQTGSGDDGSAGQQVVLAGQAFSEPFRAFLQKHADTREKEFFVKSAQAVWPADRAKQLQPNDLIVLGPAFLLTELTAAFRIGFLLYLAFTIVDLVIANVLLAMGLSQVTPTNVAIPFKLLLFISLDGWSRLVHGLVLTYR